MKWELKVEKAKAKKRKNKNFKKLTTKAFNQDLFLKVVNKFLEIEKKEKIRIKRAKDLAELFANAP